MTALARASSNGKQQTRHLVKEGVPYQQTGNCLTFKNKSKNLILGPRWGLDTKIDWPTDRRSWHDIDLIPINDTLHGVLTLTMNIILCFLPASCSVSYLF
jgi:hypothetical protein